MDDEHGWCPNCGENFDGGSIWQFYFDHSGDEAEADRLAAMFDATRTKGQWDNWLTFQGEAAPERYSCPDCGHEWPYGPPFRGEPATADAPNQGPTHA